MARLSANRQPRRWTGLALVGVVPLDLYSKVYAVGLLLRRQGGRLAPIDVIKQPRGWPIGKLIGI